MDRRLGAGCPTGEKGWQERSGRWWRLGSCGSGRGGRWACPQGTKPAVRSTTVHTCKMKTTSQVRSSHGMVIKTLSARGD